MLTYISCCLIAGTYSSRLMTGLVSRFVAPLENKAHRITSLNYGPSSHDILVSYSAENVYLFNTQVGSVDRKGLIRLVHGRKFSGCLVWVPYCCGQRTCQSLLHPCLEDRRRVVHSIGLKLRWGADPV